MDEQYIAQLVYNLQCGDQQAFEELYNQTNKMVYFICKNLLNNEEDAKDVMQDVYITAYYKIGQLTEHGKFQAWINQIAVNKCKDHLAKNKPVLMAPEEFNDTMLDENELFLPEEYIIEKEKRKIIMNIMRKSLSDIQYNTVILYYFNGLSVYEIADIMECPPGTVTYRLSVARAKIKEGVLLYENKTEDKLYSVAAIPFLVSLFAAEASGLIVPNVLPEIMTALTGTAGTAIAGMTNATFVDNVAADMGQTMMQSGTDMMSQAGQGMMQPGQEMMNQAGQGMMQPGQDMMNQAGYGSYEMPAGQGQGMTQPGYEAYGMPEAGGAPMNTGATANMASNASAVAKATSMALKTKIAIGIASAALLCGGLALVLNINKDDKDKKNDNKTEITTEQSVVNTTEEAESNTTEATSEESTEEQLIAVHSGTVTVADVGYNKVSDAPYLDEMMSLRFNMDGVSYNFPIDYSDFFQGWNYVDESMKDEIQEEIEYKEALKSTSLDSAEFSGFWVTNPKYDEKLQVRINVSNYNREPVKAIDGTINSIYVGMEGCATYPEMIFPGNITFGASMEDVIDAYGTDCTVSMTEYTYHNTYLLSYTKDSEDVKEEHNGYYDYFERGVNVVFSFNNEKELIAVGLYMDPSKFYTDRVLLNEFIASDKDYAAMSYEEAYEYLNTLPANYERKFLSSTDGMPEGECMITGYLRDDEVIVIPDTINGNKVTAIHDYAFTDLENTVAIRVPETVTVIGDGAFMELKTVCVITGLENVVSLGSVSMAIGGDDSSGTEIKAKIRMNSYEYATKKGERLDDDGTPFGFGNLIIYAPAGSDSYNNLTPHISVIGDDIIVEPY
ncbi:MAG: sigma-70 family RNA polymerase sigma factor [Lachnospiraceae bacterium]|nr:sigma-70 family RNA polymerase sigma factor [Lachnospiraceae bacterium]